VCARASALCDAPAPAIRLIRPLPKRLLFGPRTWSVWPDRNCGERPLFSALPMSVAAFRRAGIPPSRPLGVLRPYGRLGEAARPPSTATMGAIRTSGDRRGYRLAGRSCSCAPADSAHWGKRNIVDDDRRCPSGCRRAEIEPTPTDLRHRIACSRKVELIELNACERTRTCVNKRPANPQKNQLFKSLRSAR
jgi:hypothetical protein